MYSRLKILLVAALCIALCSAGSASGRPGHGRDHRKPPKMSAGTLQIPGFSADPFSPNGIRGTFFGTGGEWETELQGADQNTKRLDTTIIPNAAPYQGYIRELTRIVLPVGVYLSAGELFPVQDEFTFRLGIVVSGLAQWSEVVNIPLQNIPSGTEVKAESKIGTTLFTADFNTPIQVFPGQQVILKGYGYAISGPVAAGIWWSKRVSGANIFNLRFERTQDGAINYQDRRWGRGR
jgi:hypothetical protein